METLTIESAIQHVLAGKVRIPNFQRGFVWDAERVVLFIDSLYRRYPVGTLLLWSTHEPLRAERMLGPFSLPERNPKDPLYYVLDGQQRLTSLFGVFQHELSPDEDAPWTKVYCDAFSRDQEPIFVALADSEVVPGRHVRLNTFFDPIAYRRATEALGDDALRFVDEVAMSLRGAAIPVQEFSADTKSSVAVVFERINHQGVPLDTYQLLTAWTWSEDFDLQRSFRDLSSELEDFGFGQIGEDQSLLMRCCSAVIAGSASPDKLVEMRGVDVRERFDELANGVRGAVDFLQRNMKVVCLENVPFPAVLIPLTAYFRAPRGRQVNVKESAARTIRQWFWRCCFGRRYSSGVNRYLDEDIQNMLALRKDPTHSCWIDSGHFQTIDYLLNEFRAGTVMTRTFVLQLAQCQPLSFISGQAVDLDKVLSAYNRAEFHHLMPRQYMRARGWNGSVGESLANIAMISRADNNQIGGVAPSQYRELMPAGDAQVDEILAAALCGRSLFEDNMEPFILDRAKRLADHASKLMECDVIGISPANSLVMTMIKRMTSRRLA